jgi:hypothetical protein
VTSERLDSNASPFASGGGDVTTAPLFVGGTSPTTAAGFRLKSGSPLLCTGTYVGRNRDFGGGAVFKQGCIETRTTIEIRNN